MEEVKIITELKVLKNNLLCSGDPAIIEATDIVTKGFNPPMAGTLKRTVVNSRTISIILIIVLLFTGCSGTDQTTNSGQATNESSSHDSSYPSEVVFRTLSDQIAEWTEGQFYPGAYQKGSASFALPAEPTSFVQESEGVLYAYGNPFNEEGTERIHLLRKNEGLKEKELLLAEIPGDYTLYNLEIKNNTIFLLVYPFGMLSDTENSHLELFVYTTEGQFLLREKLVKLLNESNIIDSYVSAFTDNSGNLWVRVAELGKLFCIQPDGQVVQIIMIPENFQGGFMRGKESDELIAVLGTGTGLVFGKMNTKTNQSENYTIENLLGIQSVFPGTMYDALVMTENSLYGVSLGETTIVKELFVFTDLGVDRTILRSIEDHEDGSLSAILLERAKTEGEKVSLKPQTTRVQDGLTLACVKSNEYLVYAVSTYNTAHPDNKVTIKEYYDKYAVDASETDALNRLNSDLMDGTAGDIVCFDGISFAGGGKALLEKGVFVDLYELMDQDPEFHKEDYFTDVWRANETDGKLYRLVPLFSLNTKFGRLSDLGETTHLDESLLFNTEEPDTLYGSRYHRKDFIHDLLVFSLGDISDKNAAIYDTDQLARYVKVAGKMPGYEKFDENGNLTEEYLDAGLRWWRDFKQTKTRFYFDPFEEMNAYFHQVREASSCLGEESGRIGAGLSLTNEERKELFLTIGVPVVFSGFPVKEGCGSAIINGLSLGIPSATEDHEAAWGFLKHLLSDDYQSIRSFVHYVIPVNKGTFERYVEKLLEWTMEDDPDCGRGTGMYLPETGEEYTYMYPPTQQWMVDEFYRVLRDIKIVDEVDPHIEKIVIEEIEKYCDGRQTAEEAANNIRERVELYADEQ